MMKKSEYIRQLLEKYYQGDTGLEEENELRIFFKKGDIPSELKTDAEIFEYYSRSGSSGEDVKLFEEKLDQMIRLEGKRRILRSTPARYIIIAVAASAVILMGIFIDLRISREESLSAQIDTYEDPKLAYMEAKRVLLMVSEKMNTGTANLQNLEKINKGIRSVQPVFSFGSGIRNLDYLNKIDEVKTILSN